MDKQKKYKINVKTLRGNVITFTNVKHYIIEDGLIHFKDSFNGVPKIFAVGNCEIEPEVSN